MGRPLAQAVAEQQATIDLLTRHIAVQGAQIKYISGLAGVLPQVEAIQRHADANNPAQPVPDPADQAPSETTEQTATPEAHDDVRNPGLTPGSVGNVPADATDTVLTPGESLPTAPYTNLQDVTAPVNGTETHVPNDQTRIETDVRVGDPMAPEVAYPWNISQNQSNASLNDGSRTLACLALARLAIQAGLKNGDDLEVAAALEGNEALTDGDIAVRTATLKQVVAAQGTNQGRPAHLVPRAAAASPAGGVARTTPSLAGDNGGMVHTASAPTSVAAELADADLFD